MIVFQLEFEPGQDKGGRKVILDVDGEVIGDKRHKVEHEGSGLYKYLGRGCLDRWDEIHELKDQA